MRELMGELETSERRARYYELRSTNSTLTMLSRDTTLERQKVREIFGKLVNPPRHGSHGHPEEAANVSLKLSP